MTRVTRIKHDQPRSPRHDSFMYPVDGGMYRCNRDEVGKVRNRDIILSCPRHAYGSLG